MSLIRVPRLKLLARYFFFWKIQLYFQTSNHWTSVRVRILQNSGANLKNSLRSNSHQFVLLLITVLNLITFYYLRKLKDAKFKYQNSKKGYVTFFYRKDMINFLSDFIILDWLTHRFETNWSRIWKFNQQRFGELSRESAKKIYKIRVHKWDKIFYQRLFTPKL